MGGGGVTEINDAIRGRADIFWDADRGWAMIFPDGTPHENTGPPPPVKNDRSLSWTGSMKDMKPIFDNIVLERYILL